MRYSGLTACHPFPDLGVVAVGPSDDGLIAKLDERGVLYFPYSSQDNGLTWTPRDTSEDTREWPRAVIQEQDTVNTPRGVYEATPSGIVLQTDAGRSTVYSTAHLESSVNLWVQAQKTKHLEYRSPTIRPRSIAYDPHSGNVIAAMGIMGVAVGKPDGSWTPAVVGPYAPVDFSTLTKIGALLSEPNYWASALALPLSLIAAALFPRLWKVESGCVELLLALFVVTSVVISIVLLGWTGSTRFDSNALSEIEIVTALLGGLSLFLVSPVLVAVLTDVGRLPLGPVVISYTVMVILLTLSLLAWLLTGWPFVLSVLLAVALCIGTAIILGRHMHIVLPERDRRAHRP